VCVRVKKIRLVGKLFSGHGEGRKFLSLTWVQQQMHEKLGFHPYLGTLNLRLDEESTPQRKLLKKEVALGACTSQGYCEGLLFKATVNGVPCSVVFPQIENYPVDKLEVVAEMNLRQRLRLHDGDEVAVTVFL
jgi:riboflavin kinase